MPKVKIFQDHAAVEIANNASSTHGWSSTSLFKLQGNGKIASFDINYKNKFSNFSNRHSGVTATTNLPTADRNPQAATRGDGTTKFHNLNQNQLTIFFKEMSPKS